MNRSNATESCCVVSAVNPQLHWLSHDQNLCKWYQRLKAQFNSLICTQGSFLIIAWQYLLADVISKAEHFQFLQPSKEREQGKASKIQFFTMRKEIKLQFLISKWVTHHDPWGCRLDAIRAVRQTGALPWVLLESKPWGESSCPNQWDRSGL